MEKQVIQTGDKSSTIRHVEYDATYHSIHGAHTESMHVFINAGLVYIAEHTSTIRVFEMGFGTGLNALLTLDFAQRNDLTIDYVCLETHPISMQEVSQLNYCEDSYSHLINEFLLMHRCEFDTKMQLSPTFHFTKQNCSIQNYKINSAFNVIYYDAFAPSVQPELWTKELFEKLFVMLDDRGIVTTYCAKGQVKRDLKSVGFAVEAIAGPPGKREMTRAVKEV